MQIDVLSQNTLKLTLSKLDMFDLDIKYESLSGKNPETKRLLAHVLKSIGKDEKISFDFSGERLFIEAFPRPDGGCMLYISCTQDEGGFKKNKKAHSSDFYLKGVSTERREQKESSAVNGTLICEVSDLKTLGALCRNLIWHQEQQHIEFKSSLYSNGELFRLAVSSNNSPLVTRIIKEFGSLLGNNEQSAETFEYFKCLAKDNAAETVLSFI